MIPREAIEAVAKALLPIQGRDAFPNNLELAEAALTAALPFLVPQWRTDMENAPRDGSDFLAFGSYLYPDDKERTTYISIVFYSGNPEWPWTSDEGQHKPDFYSHWLPLPATPVTEAEDEAQ